jgi:hypothetical protein
MIEDGFNLVPVACLADNGIFLAKKDLAEHF